MLTKEREIKNLKAVIRCANSYLNNIWKTKGIVTMDDIVSVAKTILLKDGVVIVVKRAENYNSYGKICPPVEGEDITFLTYRDEGAA